MVDRFYLEPFLLPSKLLELNSVIHFGNRLNGSTLTIEDPLLHTAFLVLSELKRTDWQLESLHAEISLRRQGQVSYSVENLNMEKQLLRKSLLQAFVAGHLALHTVPPRYTYDLSGKPCASRCSRLDELSSKVQSKLVTQGALAALDANSLKEVVHTTVENIARRRLLLRPSPD